MTDRALEILDRRIVEVIAKSSDAKRKGDEQTMYRLNTVYHWLDEVRREIRGDGEGAKET